MNTIGIDLGKHGGLVLLAGDGALLGWARTPLAGKEYDGHGMAAKLRWALDKCAGQPVRAFVESPAVFGLFPPQAMAVGVGVGRWMQALDMLGVSYQFVPAQKWVPVFAPKPKRQKRGADDPKETAAQKAARRQRERKESKERLMAIARRLHPTGIPWDDLNKEDRSGVADALLIAEWGRRMG